MTASHIAPRAIQRALNMRGAALVVDGDLGPKTRAAIYAAVQRETGAAAHWDADRLLLAFEQIVLRDGGLDPGPIDGVMGPQTRRALDAWQGRPESSSEMRTSLPPWIATARKYLGVREGVGKVDNPTVVAMFAKVGHPEVRHDETPWCAAFVGACLEDAGIPSTRTLWALHYASWGQQLMYPVVGAVATKKRAGGGHVFFVTDFDSTHVWGLGGNQSDKVSIVAYKRTVVHSYAWPRGVLKPSDLRAGAFRVGAVAQGSEA
jgi:uncharacterized protein (TIGR02594 family)